MIPFTKVQTQAKLTCIALGCISNNKTMEMIMVKIWLYNSEDEGLQLQQIEPERETVGRD